MPTMRSMSSVFDTRPSAAALVDRATAGNTLGPAGWRALLATGCAVAALAGYALGDPNSLIAADAELAVLLRGMALIKAALVVAALAILWWRFRWPVPTGLAAGYLGGAWLITGATIMIWQLSAIAAAAVTFHAAEITLLVLAWRDRREAVRFPRAR
jgi:hypothetical protein